MIDGNMVAGGRHETQLCRQPSELYIPGIGIAYYGISMACILQGCPNFINLNENLQHAKFLAAIMQNDESEAVVQWELPTSNKTNCCCTDHQRT